MRTPRVRPLRSALALAALSTVLIAVPAVAETYIVTLENGTVFESRYQPEEASWDPGVVMLLTEYGNSIALQRADIAEVTTDVEIQGFGKVIDTNTISLGVLANDAIPPDEREEPDSFQQLQQFLAQQNEQPDYTVQQFAEPSQVGSGSPGGLPVGFSQRQQQSVPILLGQPQQ